MILQPLATFIVRQIVQIRRGGAAELGRKLRFIFPSLIRFPVTILELPLALLIVIAMRTLKPIYLLRLQRFISWRIGHFSTNTELYLCERDAGINIPTGRFIDIWYYVSGDYNKQLNRMWGRLLHVGPSHLLKLTASLNSWIPGGDDHKIGENTQRDRDVHNLLDRYPPHLRFLPEEDMRGQAGLRSLGIPEGAPFVCMTVRDSIYLSAQSARGNNKVDWSYHNFRDCDVQRYVRAAEELTYRGYFVVRMGAAVRESMKTANPMIIDYAANGARNDFMDIYLGAHCEFCISTGTGFDGVPSIFRRPIVFIDHVPVGLLQTFCSRSLAITKKHWLTRQRRFMTFGEIFASGAAYFEDSKKFAEVGIELIESEPEEIALVVLEMEARLKGTWQATKEDAELQELFWKIYRKNEQHGEIRSRIGAEFLRKNRAWLK